jgi:RHS repeat-associated protein
VNVTSVNTAQGAWTINTSSSYPAYATTVTDPAGKSEQWYYSAWGSSTYNYTDKRGIGHGYSMGAVIGGKGRLTEARTPYIDGGGGGLTLQSTSYNTSVGMPSQITNERGKTTTISYNSEGQPTAITDPKNQTTSITYAGNGLDVTSFTNADNTTVATYAYNAFHQPTSITDANNKTTVMTYTSWGAPLSVTDASGQTTNFNYDAVGHLQSIARGGSTLASYTYDEIGRVQTKTDAAGLTLTYQYNNLDKVTKVTYPDGTFSSVEYVCCGMPGVVTDRSGRKSYYDYDPMKRLTRMQDPAGNSVQLDYDGSGNLSRLIDAKGNVTRWVYDKQNRLVQKGYHDGMAEVYTYSQGLLAQTTNARGEITGYAYDDNDNPTVINYPNMVDVSITYNVLDKPTSMTDALGTSSFGYDVMGRLTSVDGPWTNDTINYSYDDLGRQSALGLSGSAIANYGYDALDRLSTLTSGAGTWNYSYVDNTGMLSQVTNPNGTKSVYGYDAMQRLTSVANVTATGGNLSTFAYGFDAPNTPQRDLRMYVDKTYGANPTQRVSYSYDTVDQLTAEVLSAGATTLMAKSFVYDAMGNRSAAGTASATDAVSGSYTSNKMNQITAASVSWGGGANTSTSSFAYDASGNLTQWNITGTGVASTSQREYSYDDADRLITIIDKDPATGANQSKTEFLYDGLSRIRISQEYSWSNGAWVLTPNSEKRRIYDGMDVVQERDGSNAVVCTYTRDGNIGGILAKSTPDGNFYFHYDASGNVVGLSDALHNAVATYDYDAYGNLISSSGAQAAGNAYRYSTKEYFGSAGLYNYGYRFYSTGMGRWINRDPLGENGGINLYTFVDNNPQNTVDAWGLASWVTRDRLGPKYGHAFLRFRFPCMGTHRLGFGPGASRTVSGGPGTIWKDKKNLGGEYTDSGSRFTVETKNDDIEFEIALCGCAKNSAKKLPNYKYSPWPYKPSNGGFYVCGSWVKDMWECAENKLTQEREERGRRSYEEYRDWLEHIGVH